MLGVLYCIYRIEGISHVDEPIDTSKIICENKKHFNDSFIADLMKLKRNTFSKSLPWIRKLGLDKNKKQKRGSFPVLVTAASRQFFVRSHGLVKSIVDNLMPAYPNLKFIFYDLDLDPLQAEIIRQHCKCEIRHLPVDLLPPHVGIYQNYAFKPVIVNLLYEEFGNVWWVDSSVRFVSRDLELPLKYLNEKGMLFFTYDVSSSIAAHTDRRMFEYFNEDPCLYLNFGEIEASNIAFYKHLVSRVVLRQWVSCALDQDCIAPIDSTKLLKGVVIAFLVLTTCTVNEVSSMYCLECSDVPSATDCNRVKECGSHEVCYASQIVSTSGHIFRTMGCRDTKQCSSGITSGRRDTSEAIQNIMDDKKARASDIMVCDGCCNSTWCQTELCQDIGYGKDRGPICLECQQQSPSENCTKIKECGRDEVCFEGFQQSASLHLLRQAGCYSELACNKIGAAVAAGGNSCWNCCNNDLCNTDCDLKKTAPTTPATAHITQTGNSQTPCVDITPTETCRLAQAIVCVDEDKARNSNCLHFCGYC